MATTHKTWATGEILTSDAINQALNPSTADHIPYAVATGTVGVVTTSFTGVAVDVALPAGRFTSAPIVMATVADIQSAATGATVIVRTPTATSFNLRLELKAVAAGTYTVAWTAIQMSK